MGEASSGHFAHLATGGIGEERQALAEAERRMRGEFPGWSFWRARRRDGGQGSWCATRGRQLTCQELYGGLARTLVCETPEQLHEELIIQAKLGERHGPP
ncbi:hypothetical protein [Actinomadura alba]|uniref:Uncharacterized protein n=1 Tax=Actinomadura alba TaxID=406431 RepID=A0ABR7LWH1_9ACTN|nr:hypothetical protein [Actinomadura alba]MBC6469095.1 hypothetical protein [Actinomadura alba]